MLSDFVSHFEWVGIRDKCCKTKNIKYINGQFQCSVCKRVLERRCKTCKRYF